MTKEERAKKIKKLLVSEISDEDLKERAVVDIPLETVQRVISKLGTIQRGAEKNKSISDVYKLLKENKIDADSLDGLKVKDFSLAGHSHKEVKELFESSYTKKEFNDFKKELETETKNIISGVFELNKKTETLKDGLDTKASIKEVKEIESGLKKSISVIQKKLKEVVKGLDMKGEKIINLGAPTKPKDACTKEYADTVAQRVLSMGSGVPVVSAASGATTFISLTDVPASYAGQGGKVVAVKADVSGLEFVAATGTDEKVKYDVGDITAGYVADKIIAGSGISVAEGVGADENKLVITNSNPTPYTLPTAAAATLGGVKVGDRLSIAAGVLSADVQTTDITGKANIALDNLAGVAMNAPLQWNNSAAQTLDIAPTAETTVGRALTVSAGSTVAGATINIAGGNLTLASGLGKGTGASSIIFQTGRTLTTGSTLQTLTTAMTILGSGNVGIGTTGPSKILTIADSTASDLLGSGAGIRIEVPSGGLGIPNRMGINLRTYFDQTYGSIDFGAVHTSYTGNELDDFYIAVKSGTLAADRPVERFRITSSGNVGIGITSPTGVLHLKAGTATAGTAPLKLTSGVDLTTPLGGEIEYDGTNFHITHSDAVRNIIVPTVGLTSGRIPYTITTNSELGDDASLTYDTTNGLITTKKIQGLSYKSGAPNGGTANDWKFGSIVTGQIGLVVISTQYVEIDIAGTLYKLATV